MKKIILCIAAISLCGFSLSPVSSVYAEEISETAVQEENKADENEWHMSLDKSADAELTEENGEYHFIVKNPGGTENGGNDKWDVQFRKRGISIEAGHTYRITYQISSSKDGSYYTKIGSLDGANVGNVIAGEVWHNQYGKSVIESYSSGLIRGSGTIDYGTAWTAQKISAGDTINVTSIFTADADFPECEWSFFLGGKGPNTPDGCFEAGTELYFTNLTLTDKTAKKTLVSYNPAPGLEAGDIDSNGKIELNDLTLLSSYLIGDSRFTALQIECADVNGDGLVDIADLAHFKQYITGDSVTLG